MLGTILGIILGLALGTALVWGFRAGGRYQAIASLALALLLLGALSAPTYDLKERWDAYKAFTERNGDPPPNSPLSSFGGGDCSG